MIDPYLPNAPATEARLLSAALVATPAVRDEILSRTTRSDFFDEWHRCLYDAMTSGHGLDAEKMIKHIYAQRREEWHKIGFWIARLLIDFDDSSVSGIVDNWSVYAAELRAMTDRRIKILRLMDELEEACA